MLRALVCTPTCGILGLPPYQYIGRKWNQQKFVK